MRLLATAFIAALAATPAFAEAALQHAISK